MKKKVSALILSLVLLFSMIPIPTAAEGGSFVYTDADGIEWLCTVLDETKKTVEIAPNNNSQITGDVTIPDSVKRGETDYTVTTISAYAFWDCSSLSSVEIPASVTEIGYGAFLGCISLSSVAIPASVTEIGDYAFYGCSSLSSVTILDGVATIREGAFLGCSSLSSVEIPSSVTIIGQWAFYGCSSLTEIKVDEDNQSFSSDENGILFNKNKTKLLRYPPARTATAYQIPSTVTEIGNGAFGSCSSLSSVKIPASVTTIGDWAFDYCSSLTEIKVDGNNTSFTDEDGVLFNKEKTKLLRYPPARTATAYQIPSTVTEIGDGAFVDCSSLSSVEIPDGVTTIGAGAFEGCSSLNSVTIPASVTTIGEGAFVGCSSLRTVFYKDGLDLSAASIPTGATKIAYEVTDDESTSNVTEITPVDVTFGEGVTSITISDHMVGHHYKLLEPSETIAGLTVQNTWDSDTGKCTVCGVECEHDWNSATGECNTCGKVCDHTWNAATCESPQTCTVCGKTKGSALGHKWSTSDGKCERCGIANPDAPENSQGNSNGSNSNNSNGNDKNTSSDTNADNKNNNTDSSNSNLNNRENDTTSVNTSTQTAPETGDSYMKFYIALSALFVSSAVLIFISLKRKAYQK